MNEIFLDTETTGLSFKDNHKINEIGHIILIYPILALIKLQPFD